MDEELDNNWMSYIDGTPVAYHQTDVEGYVDPVAIDGVVVEQGYIQWPDGTGVSLQLHHPADWDWRNGAGGARDFCFAMQNLVQAVLLDTDMDKLWDCAHDLIPDRYKHRQDEAEQE